MVKIVLLAETKLYTKEIIIFKALIDSNINDDESLSVNDLLNMIQRHKIKQS